jgi:hypothetical protein
MKLLTDVSAINKAIESIAKRGAKLDHDIQVAAVSCLNHVNEHGDTTVLDKLVLAMPKGARKSALTEWACAFGNVRMLDRSNQHDQNAIEQGRLFAKDKTKTFDLDGAIANMWYDFKPEPDLLTTFDAAKMVQAMVKRYNKAVKDGAAIDGIDDAKAQLAALMQSLDVQGTGL